MTDILGQRRRWSDIEHEALNNPLLAFAVTMVRINEMTREDALIAAALGLAEVNRHLAEENVKLLAKRPAAAIVVDLQAQGGRQ